MHFTRLRKNLDLAEWAARAIIERSSRRGVSPFVDLPGVYWLYKITIQETYVYRALAPGLLEIQVRSRRTDLECYYIAHVHMNCFAALYRLADGVKLQARIMKSVERFAIAA